MYLAVGEAREVLTQRLGRSPTVAEISVRAGATEAEVTEAMKAAGSYRPAIPDGHRRPDATSLMEEMPAPGDAFELVDDLQQLRELLLQFDAVEQQILAGYYFHDRTQADLGRELGVSQMTVSRMLAGVIRRLRYQMVDRPDAALQQSGGR